MVKLLIMLGCNQDHVDDKTKGEYAAMVGSLNYLANIGRPDISFSTSILSRYLSNPSKVYVETATRSLRFLKSTIKSSIVYRSSGVDKLIVYADADHP